MSFTDYFMVVSLICMYVALCKYEYSSIICLFLIPDNREDAG